MHKPTKFKKPQNPNCQWGKPTEFEHKRRPKR